ncbi:MAG: heavy-metal-associated domain-containing protein [Clostridiales bacterium]|nr:heavy-metal-associated domain-containing protein [Clostridiales bacterium]
MIQITLKIDGMMCGMCESHINDAIRRAFSVDKVKSSHGKGETVIVADNDIPDSKIAAAIADTGYKLLSIERKPYEKKKLFAFLKH